MSIFIESPQITEIMSALAENRTVSRRWLLLAMAALGLSGCTPSSSPSSSEDMAVLPVVPVLEPEPTTIIPVAPEIFPSRSATQVPELRVHTISPENFKGTGRVVWNASRSVPKVHLTIDDLEDPRMLEQALNIGKEYGVHFTFFPVGRVVESIATLLRRAAAEGHSIENHTYNHLRLNEMNTSEMEKEIAQQYEAVRKVLGSEYRQRYLRPPFGRGIYEPSDPRIAQTAARFGLNIAMWKSDSRGFEGITGVAAQTNVLKNFNQGEIVVMHTVPADIQALPGIIKAAQAHKWQCVSLADASF